MPRNKGGGKSPFNLNQKGVSIVSKDDWIDLGLIPNGQQYQIGLVEFTPIEKSLTCEIRPNIISQSQSTESATSISGKSSTKAGTTKKIDLWRKGRLVSLTALSTGVEHWWLRFTSKKQTPTEVIWSVSYMELY